jgi:Ser-tRNA(Ala) deacylase AlaX
LYLFPQEDGKRKMTEVYINSKDTVYFMMLSEVEIFGKVKLTADEQKQYNKMVRHVLKVYPYAKLAGMKFREYQPILDEKKNDRDRKKYMKKMEDELWNTYGEEIKKLTYTQGQILIKLIDRETEKSGYVVLQELRGKFRAFFYQGFAKLWGYNLKTEYDPSGEDWMIEYIVQKIERGEL